MSKVTQIGKNSPNARVAIAGVLRAWADKVLAGEVDSVALCVVHGSVTDLSIHWAFHEVSETPRRANVLAGLAMLHDDVIQAVRGVTERENVFELQGDKNEPEEPAPAPAPPAPFKPGPNGQNT